MSRRHYRMGKRAEAAERTRQAIVEATYALHNEQRIADTTMKQIAERANVALGSVYHHFPTYNDVVRACGAHTLAVTPPPDATIFEGAADVPARVRALARALFDFYARCPGIGQARLDESKIPALRDTMAELDALVEGLVAEALRSEPVLRRRAPVLAALLDFDSYKQMTRRGLSAARAAETVAEIVNAWLAAPSPARRAKAKPRGAKAP